MKSATQNTAAAFSWDRDHTWSKRIIERDLSTKKRPFKFRGPGWYLTETDSVLIIALGKSAGKFSLRAGEPVHIYRVLIWNRPSIGNSPDNPAALFAALANAPTRFDSRDGEPWPSE